MQSQPALLPSAAPTVGEVLTYFCPRLSKDKSCPTWPPDIFGLMSVLLELSGSYLSALRDWPVADFGLGDAHQEFEVLEIWRAELDNNSFGSVQIPEVVKQAWEFVLVENWATSIQDLPKRPWDRVARACLLLLRLADSISRDVLNPLEGVFDSEFKFQALLTLFENDRESGISSLGREVNAGRLTILPKRRTPKTGLSLRSLSLYLGAIRTSEVHAKWSSDVSFAAQLSGSKSTNLLLIPSPERLNPRQFERVAARPGDMANMNSSLFGFLTYRANLDPEVEVKRILLLLANARETVGSIDAIVMPEASISDEVLRVLVERIQKMPDPVAVLAGVSKAAESGRSAGENKLAWIPRSLDPESNIRVQSKHHRWQIDRSQIVQYQLGSALDPDVVWWEYIELRQRELNFIQFTPWLTVAPLICEDLARPDPVSEILRAVGPDLVIALLMDGPQLPHRWAARNAMTLADDPGCSVLTLTSAGMVDLSNTRQPNPRRVVALYKDPTGPAQEIELPADAGAVILTLSRMPIEEWSADGRPSQPGRDFHPVLSGVRFLKRVE